MTCSRTLLVLVLALAGATTCLPRPAQAIERFGETISTSADWQNESRASGDPSGTCNSSTCCSTNIVSNSGDWLEVTQWQAFTVPANEQIVSVEVAVNVRYDEGTTGNQITLRVRGSVTQATQNQNLPTQTTSCAWRTWTITPPPGGWDAASAAGLRFAIRSNTSSTTNTCRVEAFRIRMTTGPCISAPSTPGIAIGCDGTQLTLTWPVVAGATSYGVYRDGGWAGLVYTNAYYEFAACGSHCYAVNARNACGEGAASPLACVTIGGPGFMPTGFTLEPFCSAVRLRWTGPTCVQYEIYRDGARIAQYLSGFEYVDTSAGTANHCYYVVGRGSCGLGIPSGTLCGNGLSITPESPSGERP